MADREITSERLRRVVVGLAILKLIINTTQRAVYPFLPAIARGLGVSLTAAGAMISVRWGAGLLSPLLVGSAGRRRSPLALMTVGSIGFAAGAIITAVSGVFTGAIIGFALLGISKPVFDIGATTYVSERVSFARRARYLGLLEMSWAGGLLVGAPLFGLLIHRYEWWTPFLVVGLLGLIGAGTMVAISMRDGSASPEVEASVYDAIGRSARPFLLVAALMSASIEQVLVVMGEWLEVGFGLTLLALGVVGMVLGVVELVAEGGVLAFTDRVGPRKAIQIGIVGMVVGLGALGVVPSTFVAGMVALAFALLFFEFGIVSAISLATEMRPDNRPKFIAYYLVATGIGRVVGDWSGPALFGHSGMASVAIVSAVAAIAALVIVSTLVEDPQPIPD